MMVLVYRKWMVNVLRLLLALPLMVPLLQGDKCFSVVDFNEL
jgi:hypothetical protein